MAKHKRGGKPSKRANSRRPSGSSSAAMKPSGPAAVDRRIWIAIAGVAVAVLVMGMLAIGAAGGGGGATPTPTALAAVPAADIAPAEANQRWDAGALLLDVREQDEWDAGHVPGATHIALSELASRVGELPTDKTILVICRSGNRSLQAREILTAAGLTATSVTGGVKAWRDAGLVYQGDILEG
ncbi:MAG: rhodanese-like domain-containing protein [Chloroflexota bacterium]